jgi:dTDP-4-amino-4,6-dideoxygalactose transaminase
MSSIPYALPDIGEAEIDAVAAAMRSGWVTTGPAARAFEEEFAARIGGGVEAVGVNSATAGLHLVMEAIGVGEGDEVIAPTLTFTATVEVARYLGANPRIVDVDPATLNIDPLAVEAAITPRTKAIVVVHYGGLACGMDEIFEIAERHGIAVIEDAAHAFPTTYKGETIGTLRSTATVFSFYANKTMTTGEGGMIVSRNRALLDRTRKMRLHGIDRDAFDRFRSRGPSWYYEVVAPGYKYNLSDMAAALGRVQLTRIDAFAARREAIAARYDKAWASLPVILPPRPMQGDAHAWHIYALRLDWDGVEEADRNAVIARLAEEGVGTSVHYVPLHRHPYWRDRYALDPVQYAHAERIYATIFSVPLYTAMRDDQIDRVIDAVSRVVLEQAAGAAGSASR